MPVMLDPKNTLSMWLDSKVSFKKCIEEILNSSSTRGESVECI